MSTTFLKYYQNNVLIVKAEIQNGNYLFTTCFEAKNNDESIERHRYGILIKEIADSQKASRY